MTSPRPTRRSGRTCPRRSRRLAGGGRPWSCPGRLARAADGRTPFTAPRGAACCPYPTMLPKRSARVHGARATPVRVTTGPEVRSRATTRTRKSASSAVMIVAKIRTREFLRSRSLSFFITHQNHQSSRNANHKLSFRSGRERRRWPTACSNEIQNLFFITSKSSNIKECRS